MIDGTREAVAAAGAGAPDDVRRHPLRLANPTPETALATRQLRELLHRRVYRSPGIDHAREETDRKVAELFQFFLSRPEQLPEAYRTQARSEALHRVVCDYIAGMTDRFALQEHRKLFNPDVRV